LDVERSNEFSLDTFLFSKVYFVVTFDIPTAGRPGDCLFRKFFFGGGGWLWFAVLPGLLGPCGLYFTAGALLSLWLTVFLGNFEVAAESVFFAAEFSLPVSPLGLTTLDFLSNSSCNFLICSYFAALSWNIYSTGVTNYPDVFK
jgi:hypothetical protein